MTTEIDYTNNRFIKNTWDKQIWDMKELNPITKNYSISIVQTCMGRAHDLKRTLPFNMLHNPNSEFVIINYNSKDDLDDYIKKNHMVNIESGRLSYYHTIEPVLYSMSHSRNIGFRVAKNELISSVDADNFLGDPSAPPTISFEQKLNELANQEPRSMFGKGISGTHGHIAFHKDIFHNELGGYAEDFETRYGAEDKDLIIRGFLAGLKFYYWNGTYCHRIETSKNDKVKNHSIKSIHESEKVNKAILANHLENKIINVNGKNYGKACLLKNFTEEIILN